MTYKTNSSFLKGGRGLFAIMLRSLLLGFLLSMMLLPQLSSSVLAQTSGAQVQPPTQERIISYQALIHHAGVPVPDGLYHITASLYTDADGRTLLWRSAYAAHVQGGVANLNLGEVRNGGAPLPVEGLDGPLYLGIRIGSSKEDLGEELRPLTRLSSSLNALSVADNSITKEKLATSYVEKIIVGSDTLDAKASTLNLKAGKGITLSKDNSDRVVITALPQQGSTPNSTVYWSESGNSSLAGTAYLGTSDASPLPIKVKGARVMQYSDNAASPIILGGHPSNTTTSAGAVIAGGGNATSPNDAQGGYGVISGGLGNTTGNYAVVSGGENNEATSDWSVVGGGQNNVTTGDEYTTIGGGEGNDISGAGSQASTIAGGLDNEITGGHSAIGGGYANTISGDYSAIPGGQLLELGDNSFGFNGFANLVNLQTEPNVAYLGDVDVWIKSANSSTSKVPNQLRFYQAPWVSGDFYTSFRAPVGLTANVEYVLPNVQGAANTVLTNSGSGTLSWTNGNGSMWTLTGNTGTTVGTNYLGTNDDEPFEIRVDNSGTSTQGRRRVARFEPMNVSPTIIMGHNENSATSTYYGVTISGGGETTKPNTATGNYASIGGGFDNRAQSYSTIAGGSANRATSSYSAALSGNNNEASNQFSLVVGGLDNIASGKKSALVGGEGQLAAGENSFAGGGDHNEVGTFAKYGVAVGGHHNRATSPLAFVGGGGSNTHIPPDPVTGYSNEAKGDYSVVVGGSSNEANGSYSFVGGGGHDWDLLFVTDPTATNSNANIASAPYAAIVAGSANRASGQLSFIGGGGDDPLDASGSVWGNTASSGWSAIVGGRQNVASGELTFIGGGANNQATARLATIGGGGTNGAKSQYATVAGGGGNQLNINCEGATIGGGENNYTTSAPYATIPGGYELAAKAYAQVVVGASNKELGGSATAMVQDNTRIFIIGNGVDSDHRSNAFEVSRNGHSIVFDDLGIEDDGTPSANPADPAIYGATFVDNIIYAWGDVPAGGGTATASFGIDPIVTAVGNKYTIRLNLVDPYGTPVTLSQASVTATIKHNFEDGDPGCKMLSCSNIVGNQFTVYTHSLGSNGECGTQALPFFFKVTGRANQ